jgi:hypothetical protein
MKSFKQLIELANVKKYYGYESLSAILLAAGYKHLGSGFFASVWQPPNKDYVIKFWVGTDRSYEAFLSYCIKNKGNVNLPVLKGRLKSFPAIYNRSNKEEMVKRIKLEKLEPLDSENSRLFFSLLFDSTYKPKTYEELMLKLLIGDLMDNIVGWNDLKVANVMQRSNRTIVITDPWAHNDSVADVMFRTMEDERELKYNKPHYLEKD